MSNISCEKRSTRKSNKSINNAQNNANHAERTVNNGKNDDNSTNNLSKKRQRTVPSGSSARSPSASNFSAQFTASNSLIQSLRANNPGYLWHESIELRQDPVSGVGVFSRAPLAPETVIMQFNCADLFQLRNFGPAATKFPLEDPWSAFILLFLHEKSRGEASKFHSYFQSLPSHYDQPFCWTEKQRKSLENCEILNKPGFLQVSDAFDSVIEPFIRKNPSLFPVESLRTKQAYNFALGCCVSRCFLDGAGLPCLAPTLDLLNTSLIKPTNCFVKRCVQSGSQQLFQICVNKATTIAPDTELTISYGNQLNNANLLLRYGFVVPENPYSGCEIGVDYVAAISLDELQHNYAHNTLFNPQRSTKYDNKELLEEENYALPEESFELKVNCALPSRLLKYVACFLNEYRYEELLQHSDNVEEKENLRFNGEEDQRSSGENSAENETSRDQADIKAVNSSSSAALVFSSRSSELRCYEILYLLLKQRLMAFKSTLDEDEQRLRELQAQDCSADDQRRMILSLFIHQEEKSALLYHLGLISSILQHS
jgi:hypothetical protein